MKIVTGATGMLGAHFLYHLSLENDTVVGLYRSEEKQLWVKELFLFYAKENADQLWQKIEWRKADLLSIVSLEDALQDATEVYHCAANVSMVTKHPENVISNNVDGTANLVDVLLGSDEKIKLLHVSSIAALGKPEKGNTVSVTTEWKTDDKHSAYSDSKYYSEMEVWRASEEGLEVLSVLPGVIIGPAPWEAPSMAPFKLMKKGLNYASDGLVGLVAVNDVVKQSIALLKNNANISKRFVMVADTWSYKLFVESAARTMQNSKPIKVLSQSKLKQLGRLERIKSFFTRKPVKLNKSTIDALTNKNNYDGDAVVEASGVPYSSLTKSIDEVGAWLSR